MPDYYQFIQNEITRRKTYFHTAAVEIAEKNLRLLKTISIIASILLVLLMLVTPLIIPGWLPSLAHILLLPVSIVMILLAHWCQNLRWNNVKYITIACLFFEAVLFIFIMAIDILQSPDVPASFMPMLCISMPTLLILPFRLHYGMILLYEIIYIVATINLKTAFIAQYDIFNSIVGIAFSFSMAQVMMSLRIQDHDTRRRYQKLSTQDSLSGLLNKTACMESVIRYLHDTAPNTTCTLLILDLDNFKQINDLLGHYTGDSILQTMGNTLIDTFRSTDIVGRFGGDEFLVLMKDNADYDTMEQKCSFLRQKLRETCKKENTISTTCSIGGVLVNSQHADFNDLYRQADQALYEAKAAGKNNHILRHYQPDRL